jgi:tRNA modification GTPase
MTQTIYALASASGKAGIAVVRVSGPQALSSLEALSSLRAVVRRKAHYFTLTDPVSRETIDQAIVLFFESPKSYTGEDVAEYHIHGSKAVLDSLLKALSRQPNHRLAMPGEFTRRAFENGRMDLTEAEAVADLIDAQTQLQMSQAMNQMGGALRRLYEGWATALKKILAHMEADLEFPDEDDLQGAHKTQQTALQNVLDQMTEHLSDERRGERLRQGIQIAVLGAPNAGKSSLVNALARREVAIVSDLAGTTRDIIEVHLDLGGYPVTLLDTAGLRELSVSLDSHGRIEKEGINRALYRAEQADILLLLYDGTQAEPDPYTLSLTDERAIVVASKADQPQNLMYDAPILRVSSHTDEGMSNLLAAITLRCAAMITNLEQPALSRARHRDALQQAVVAMKRSVDAALPELAAEDIRLAVRHIGQITGRIDVEDVLDVVFRDFCIGK